MIRAGNAAFERGDAETAERCYGAAAERTADPGLVAFNRGTVALRRGDLRDAEVNYVRTLDDHAAPADRRARALYNRGVCLVTRGGAAGVYRSAVACFEQAADLAGDDPLAADARHNLEVAKLLWNRARAKERVPPRPDQLPDDVRDPLPPPPEPDAGRADPGPGDDKGPGGARPDPLAGRPPPGGNPRETPQKAPGAGGLPVRLDDDRAEPLSPDEAKDLLRRVADRLHKDRRDMGRLTAGPERPHVRDW